MARQKSFDQGNASSRIVKLTNKSLKSKKEMRNIAVILAGGSGRRLGLAQPKQFLKMAGKMIIEHTVDAFETHEMIDEIAIVVHPMFYTRVEEMVAHNGWKKVRKILNGGGERYESSLSAIEAYSQKKEDVNLIFHDSVRPLVSARIITDVCKKLESAVAVDVVVPAVDTIVRVDTSGCHIKDIPNRCFLRRGQTPQGFRLGTIKVAYDIAMNDPSFHATDDCGIVVKYLPDVQVDVVNGEECNIKLTNPEDIYLLDKLFQIKSTVPNNFNLNELKDKVLVIFGGNSGIGKDMANIAESYGARVVVYSRSNGNVDVSKLESVKEALKQVYAIYGKINFVVNTAAILNKEPILNLSEDIIRKIAEVNYLGAINTTLASFEYLEKSHGQVLQFTSSSYTRGRAFYAMYSSSKSAVVNFVQAIAEEWARYGIRVNCINPQRTKTPMRVTNFGNEDPSTLLKSEEVAMISIETLLNNFTGEVVDIKLNASLESKRE